MTTTLAPARQPTGSARFGSVVMLEAMHAAGAHVALLTSAGIDAAVASDADDLIARLAGDWTIALAVVDLALLSPAALGRLSRTGGLRLLAIVGDSVGDNVGNGDIDAAGLMMAANLVGFLARDDNAAVYLAAVEAGLETPAALQVGELSDSGIARIDVLSAEVERIVGALASLAAGERRIVAGGARPVTAVQIRAIIKARRLRERFFPAALFADPVWDMLLDLTAARLEAQPVAVSSLCLAAAVPTTTALRQIKALCDAGMFVRSVDDSDARRTFISLTEASARAMLDYLGSLRGEGPVV